MATKLNNTQANSLASKLQRDITTKLSEERDSFLSSKVYTDELAKIRKTNPTISSMLDLEKGLRKLEPVAETVNELYQNVSATITNHINKQKLSGHVSYYSKPDSIYVNADDIQKKREYLERKMLTIHFKIHDVAIPTVDSIYDELIISTIDSTTDLETFMKEFVAKYKFLP